MLKKCISILLTVCLLLSLSTVALADRVDAEGYLVLGADLTAEQTETVYDLLGITDDSRYERSYTTNKEEHDALDDYLSSSVIGTKALSSILLLPDKKGSGIKVEAYNISYCTVSMYQNALIDAGVEDCTLYIAAPVSVSGTCALVSAMKAYSLMTGEEIHEDRADAAVDELVTTGLLGDLIGSNDKAAELVAALKQQMLEGDLSEEDIASALDKLCIKMDITLDENTRQQLIDLMMKLKGTNIDVDALKEQAGALYNKVKDTFAALDIDKEKAQGFFAKLVDVLMELLGMVKK